MKVEIYIKMQQYNYTQYILKEGYTNILTAFGISILLLIIGFSFFAKIGFLVTLTLLWIYRNDLSKVHNPQNLENTIYSPIDGVISGVDFIDGVKKVYIDVGLCENHILRAPINGIFEVHSLKNGLNLSSWTFKSKSLNNQAVITFDDKNGETTKMTAIGGICATKISLDNIGNEVNTSDKIGVFTQGTVILDLPKTYELKVKIGEKLNSGVSVIAGKVEPVSE